MLNSMRKFSKEPCEMIRRKVAAGKVAGADETGVSGKNSWLRAFQNGVATYLAFDSSRSHGAITENFTPKELGEMDTIINMPIIITMIKHKQ